jgi:hypothetical protein
MYNNVQIDVALGTSDFSLFSGVVNQGIDDHLEAFTKSKFTFRNGRLYCSFARSEVAILLRRLRELGTEDAEEWAEDIESALMSSQTNYKNLPTLTDNGAKERAAAGGNDVGDTRGRRSGDMSWVVLRDDILVERFASRRAARQYIHDRPNSGLRITRER